MGKVIVLVCAALVLNSCSLPTRVPASYQKNFCKMMEANSGWFRQLMKVRKKTESHPWVVMAIIHQESRFDPHAVPKGTKRANEESHQGAYGYAQAIKTTWDAFRKQTGNLDAERSNFKDATEFIGWYNDISHNQLGIDLRNTHDLYLAYHEGHGGFSQKTYRKPSNKWVVAVAKKVAKQSERYRKQFRGCNGK